VTSGMTELEQALEPSRVYEEKGGAQLTSIPPVESPQGILFRLQQEITKPIPKRNRPQWAA
jgi:hypothetical protein